MYPSRSQKHSAQKKARKRRRGRIWGTINVTLLAMIAILVIIYFISDNKPSGGELASLNKNASPNQTQQDMKQAETSEGHDPVSEKPDPKDSVSATNARDAAGKQDAANSDSAQESKKDQGASDAGKEKATADPLDKGSKESSNTGVAYKKTGPPDGKGVTLHFVGDMIFSGKVEGVLEKKGYDFPYAHLGEQFNKDDLTVGNLETPVTTRGVGAKNKQFVFKSSPKALDALHAAGMDIVNLANNHILDQGEEGLLDTIEHLDHSGIKYVGAGNNAQRAYEPQYVTRGGMKIAVIGCSRVYPEPSWAAGANKSGVASAYNPDPVLKKIAEARKNADLVIVMVHWGIERQLTPDDNQKKLAHAFVDAGADLIIGSHPHVLQGMEQYKGKWIAYSTGNFIFTKSNDPNTWKTAIFQARCDAKSGCGMKLMPYKTEVGQPVPMTATEGQQLLQEVQKLSIGNIRIGTDGTVMPGT